MPLGTGLWSGLGGYREALTISRVLELQEVPAVHPHLVELLLEQILRLVLAQRVFGRERLGYLWSPGRVVGMLGLIWPDAHVSVSEQTPGRLADCLGAGEHHGLLVIQKEALVHVAQEQVKGGHHRVHDEFAVSFPAADSC